MMYSTQETLKKDDKNFKEINFKRLIKIQLKQYNKWGKIIIMLINLNIIKMSINKNDQLYEINK